MLLLPILTITPNTDLSPCSSPPSPVRKAGHARPRARRPEETGSKASGSLVSVENGEGKLAFSPSVPYCAACLTRSPHGSPTGSHTVSILHSDEGDEGPRGRPSSSSSPPPVAGQSGDHWRTRK